MDNLKEDKNSNRSNDDIITNYLVKDIIRYLCRSNYLEEPNAYALTMRRQGRFLLLNMP